ncbi:outer membrane lipoprotein carrier protein LolA [Acidobacteria bacterium AB60]|nr:outer membrane lipoprotein carrier protein LolA [Acidobacteria bacterium AB60]
MRLLAAAILCAVTAVPAQKSTLDVHVLAQRVDHHYNQLHSLKAGFSESYDGLGMHRHESGTLLLEKPGHMRWDYTAPRSKLFLLDGKYAWFYAQGDPQVQRLPAKQLDDLRSPLRFLLGHTQLEKELTHLTASPGTNGSFTLTGQPKGQEKRVPRIAITATVDGVITGIEIEGGEGAITRFTFTDEQTNVGIPAGAFHFTPPAGIPVVDAPPPV